MHPKLIDVGYCVIFSCVWFFCCPLSRIAHQISESALESGHVWCLENVLSRLLWTQSVFQKQSDFGSCCHFIMFVSFSPPLATFGAWKISFQGSCGPKLACQKLTNFGSCLHLFMFVVFGPPLCKQHPNPNWYLIISCALKMSS